MKGTWMKRKSTMSVYTALVLVLVLLAAFIGGFYLLVRTVGIEGSLIWSTLVAAMGWIVSEHISRRREHQRLLANQKQDMYFKFLDFLLTFMKKAKEPHGQESNDELIEEMMEWSLRLMLIGSDDVVRAWNSFRDAAGERDVASLFGNVARLLTEMRKDCGHHGTTLSNVELLSVMIKADDLEQLHDTMKNE